MADDYTATIRIRRPAKVTTDERGRSVWADTVETAELELVSTGELKQILESSDAASRSAIERIIAGNEEGVLARDPATGLFEIISDAELQAVRAENDQLPKTARPADVTLESVPDQPGATGEELSLVSTQVLRKILRDPPGKAPPAKKDPGGGFDPYDSG